MALPTPDEYALPTPDECDGYFGFPCHRVRRRARPGYGSQLDCDFFSRVFCGSSSLSGEPIDGPSKKRQCPIGSERSTDKQYPPWQLVLAEQNVGHAQKFIESATNVLPVVVKLKAGEDEKAWQDTVVIFADENDKVISIRKVE